MKNELIATVGALAFFHSWVLVAGLAYFCHANNVILDKILLGQRRISSPLSYAFYGGIWSILALILIPLTSSSLLSLPQFFMPSWWLTVVALGSGAFSILALWAIYSAIKVGEASRVATVLGGLSPILVLILSMLFFGSFLTVRQFGAFALFIVGGWIISREKKEAQGSITLKTIFFIFLAATFFALTYTLEKIVFNHVPFLQGFIWTRVGAFGMALSFLLVPQFRKQISAWSPRNSTSTSGLFVVNKLIGALGFFLLSYAIKIAASSEVSIINALQGFEYVLVFVIALALSKWRPAILSEKFDTPTLLRKVFAIFLISAGLFLLY